MYTQPINRDHLTHLIARDLFESNLKQVFSAKSGKYLGVIDNRQTLFAEVEEVQDPVILEPENKNQLSLF